MQPRHEDADRNPLGDLIGGVARGVGHGVESIFCAITRKPLSGNAGILGETSVLIAAGHSPARIKSMSETVTRLGGSIVQRPDLATHCVVPEGLRAANLDEHRELFEICHALNVTVVEPSWVEAAATMASTQREANWNVFIVDSHVSPIMAELTHQLASEENERKATRLPSASDTPPPLKQEVGALTKRSRLYSRGRSLPASRAAPAHSALVRALGPIE